MCCQVRKQSCSPMHDIAKRETAVHQWKIRASEPCGVYLLQLTNLGFVVLMENIGKADLGVVDAECC